jgi:hypothetical protein
MHQLLCVQNCCNMLQDYSIHPLSGKERRLNLIVYLTPEWDNAWYSTAHFPFIQARQCTSSAGVADCSCGRQAWHVLAASSLARSTPRCVHVLIDFQFLMYLLLLPHTIVLVSPFAFTRRCCFAQRISPGMACLMPSLPLQAFIATGYQRVNTCAL